MPEVMRAAPEPPRLMPPQLYTRSLTGPVLRGVSMLASGFLDPIPASSEAMTRVFASLQRDRGAWAGGPVAGCSAEKEERREGP